MSLTIGFYSPTGYNLTSSDLDGTTNTVLTLHRLVETFKFAYAKRTDLGDEDFINVTAVSGLCLWNDCAEICNKHWQLQQ